jgi:hypothetical protein
MNKLPKILQILVPRVSPKLSLHAPTLTTLSLPKTLTPPCRPPWPPHATTTPSATHCRTLYCALLHPPPWSLCTAAVAPRTTSLRPWSTARAPHHPHLIMAGPARPPLTTCHPCPALASRCPCPVLLRMPLSPCKYLSSELSQNLRKCFYFVIDWMIL